MINSMNILCKKELQNFPFTLGSCSHSSLSFITSLNSLIHFLNEITQNSKYSESLFFILFKNIGTQCHLMLFFKLAIKIFLFFLSSISLHQFLNNLTEWMIISKCRGTIETFTVHKGLYTNWSNAFFSD